MAGDPNAWPSVAVFLLVIAAASLAWAWLRIRWGRWQSWLVGFPVIAVAAVLASQQVTRLLPNLL
jgi:hypothetical protein